MNTPRPMSGLDRYRALVSHRWEEGQAAEAVIAAQDVEIERLRSIVVREKEPRRLTPAQERALLAFNDADLCLARGDEPGAVKALAKARRNVRISRALRARGLITLRPGVVPQLTPAGWAWVEDYKTVKDCGGGRARSKARRRYNRTMTGSPHGTGESGAV